MKTSSYSLILILVALAAGSVSAQYTPTGCLNADEAELAQLVNDYRAENALPAVPVSANLTLVAQWHVADHNYAEDVTQEFGSDPACNLHTWYGIPGAPYGTCCYTSDHAQAACMWDKPVEISGGVYTSPGFENAAWGYSSAAAALDGWKASSGHNDVILNQGIWANYTWLAMGVGVDTDSKRYFLWFSYTADPAGDAAPCGLSAAGQDMAEAFALRAVYPNPFNPRTTITYSLPEPGHVSIAVFDVAGRLVRTLAEGARPAGLHSQTWNGADDRGGRAASGTYFMRLVTAQGIETRKVTLAK